MDSDNHYYQRPAAAFVRGKAKESAAIALSVSLRDAALEDLSPEQLQTIIRAGSGAGLRLHKFKKTMGLRRVNRVLGILRGVGPRNVLDVGSGRGTFLWPLLDAFPDLPLTCIDRSEVRIGDIQAVHDGGMERVSAKVMDATGMSFDRRSFDVVTFLEVLEHIPDAQAALTEALGVAQRFVIVSVPSKKDNNPEHIHLFDKVALGKMFGAAGAGSITFDYVLNHLIAVARVRP